MKNKSLLASPATLALLAAPALAGDEVAFRPEPGIVLKKTFTTEQYVSLNEITIQMGEQVQTPEQFLEMSTTQTITVTDQYRAVGEGRPLLLRRSFDRVRLSGAAEFPGQGGKRSSKRIDSTSKLEGQGVVFTWVPEEGEYGRYFDAYDPDEELLIGLDEDLDARVLLPGKTVSQGDSWEIPPADMRRVLAHCGRLTFDVRQGEDPIVARLLSSGVGGPLDELFGEKVEGEARATYEGRREVDGVEMGVIAFRFSIKVDVDQKERAQRRLSAVELSSNVSVDGFTTESGLQGRGELLWNLSAGHAHALSAEVSGHLQREEIFVRPTAMQKDRMVRSMALGVQVSIKASFAGL